MLNKYEIAIIGTGIIGRLLAITLLNKFENISLYLYEKSSDFTGKSSCGYAAAGMVAPICESLDEGQEIYDLAKNTIQLWKEVNIWLSNDIFLETGTNIIAHPLDIGDFETKITRANGLQINKNYITHKSLADEYNKQKLLNRMLHIKNEGYVDVPVFFQKSSKYLKTHPSVKTYLDSEINQDTIKTLQSHYDYVCDTRGIGAKDNLKDLYGIRGESLIVSAPEIKISAVTRLCHPRFPLYIVPRNDGLYYIGASIIQSEDMSNISVVSQLTLLSALLTVNESFSEARIIRNFTHIRPTFKEGLPRILQHHNLIKINGFYRHGYLFAPILCLNTVEKIKNS